MGPPPEKKDPKTGKLPPLPEKPQPQLPPERREPQGPYPYRWRYSPPQAGSNASGSADSSSDFTVDTTSGMDDAVKRGDALSDAVGVHRTLMYGNGGPLDLGALMGSAARIRALKSYLSSFGPVSESSPYPIRTPLTRLGGARFGSRSGANASQTAQSGGWDAYQ